MQIKNVRFIIAAITTFSAYAVYVSRVNLSIAIIAMVDDGHQHATSATNEQGPRLADSAPIGPAGANLSGGGAGLDLNPNPNPNPNPNANSYPSPSAGGAPANGSSPTGRTPIALNGSAVPADEADKLHRAPLSTIFPASKKSVKTPLISQEKFHWDQTEQGHILGAFFYGYILFQIPGARMAESVGAKWIIMAANAGSALISLIFPLSTQLNSIHLLMVLRFVMGLCQSAFFPAAYVLFCRWLPERERSVLLPIMFIGSNMGSISTYIMSSYLISASHGWPSVFYVSGLICTLVTVLWCTFGSNGPDDNWLITDKERAFIETHVCGHGNAPGGRARTKTEPALGEPLVNGTKHYALTPACLVVPSKGEPVATASGGGGAPAPGERGQQLCWPKLFRSVPVWTLILSMYGNEWSNAVLCYELPTYLNTALSIPIEQNGVINSFFQLSYTLVSPVTSSLGAYMLSRHLFGMRKIHVRKLFQSLATFGQLACFVSVPICGANRGLIIMFMFSAVVFKACANAGDIMVPGDLSPEYAGTIFAFANSIGNTAGFFVPILAGAFVRDAYERVQWTPFWLTTAAIMGTSGLIFVIFGETSRQNFAADAQPHPESATNLVHAHEPAQTNKTIAIRLDRMAANK